MNILDKSVNNTTLDSYFRREDILNTRKGRFISYSGGKFLIQKRVNGQIMPFGYFDTFEDAVIARDILVNNNWDIDKVPEGLYSWRFFTEYNPLTHTWEISNLIGDDIVSFGLFKSIPIAKKALEILIENNWDSSYVPLEYYYEDSNIRPFKRSKGTYYGVVRRINFELVTIATFEEKRDAIAFRDNLFMNNWNLDEEEQLFDNYILVKGDKYTVMYDGVEYGVFDRICDASEFVIECVKNNWWLSEVFA